MEFEDERAMLERMLDGMRDQDDMEGMFNAF